MLWLCLKFPGQLQSNVHSFWQHFWTVLLIFFANLRFSLKSKLPEAASKTIISQLATSWIWIMSLCIFEIFSCNLIIYGWDSNRWFTFPFFFLHGGRGICKWNLFNFTEKMKSKYYGNYTISSCNKLHVWSTVLTYCDGCADVTRKEL